MILSYSIIMTQDALLSDKNNKFITFLRCCVNHTIAYHQLYVTFEPRTPSCNHTSVCRMLHGMRAENSVLCSILQRTTL